MQHANDDPTETDIFLSVQISPEAVTQLEELELDERNAGSDGMASGPLICLVAQHFSNSWGIRSYEFAAYLYLIVLFPHTFIPAAVLGFSVTATGLSFSGFMGGMVDSHCRLPFVKTLISLQKAFQAILYCIFLVLFLLLRDDAKLAFEGDLPDSVVLDKGRQIGVYALVLLITAVSSILGLTNVGINVAVERDWVVAIANGSSARLTTLNTYMRRVDLLTALVAPLVVSLLTTLLSYPTAALLHLSLALITFIFEFMWISVVWKSFEQLAVHEERTSSSQRNASGMMHCTDPTISQPGWATRLKNGLLQQTNDMREFVRLPVFLTSVAISMIYFTTLSFDGIMISYLKTELMFSDGFIAAMRALSVVTGLIGTLVMPRLGARMGLVRAGAWSIWFEVICLIPVLISLYITGLNRTVSACLLFGGMALSRIGLWSFDLVQLQMLQESLAKHSRQNSLTALQVSLQNMFDLAKYAIVLTFHRPAEFKWTALASWIAVFSGGTVYSVYLFKVRGHITHYHWCWPNKKGDPRVDHDYSAVRSDDYASSVESDDDNEILGRQTTVA